MRALALIAAATTACSAPERTAEAAAEPTPAAAAGIPGVDAPQRGLDVLPLEVWSGGRVHRFQVEVARTEEQQRIGMMFRQGVDPDRGMIFPYERAGQLGFWMRNVPIPLDIIYIRPNGTIAKIATARPHDETSIPSGEPASLVLELAGGRAAELGIRTGDRVSVPGLPFPASGR